MFSIATSRFLYLHPMKSAHLCIQYELVPSPLTYARIIIRNTLEINRAKHFTEYGMFASHVYIKFLLQLSAYNSLLKARMNLVNLID
jgi:hypothetical protein